MPYVSGPVLGYPIIYLGAVICKYASLEPSSILQSSPNPSLLGLCVVIVCTTNEKQVLFGNGKIKTKTRWHGVFGGVDRTQSVS